MNEKELSEKLFLAVLANVMKKKALRNECIIRRFARMERLVRTGTYHTA